MKLRFLSSATDGDGERYFAHSLVVNETLCIDAGSLGFFGDMVQQTRVRHVLLSHAHLDHTASLPIFLENVYSTHADCVTVHASTTVHEWLQKDMFNWRLWPDFVALSETEEPFLKATTLRSGETVVLEGLAITPVEVHHGVPSFGFVIDDGSVAIAVSCDTGPTQALWDLANRTPNLKSVFLECSFPESKRRLAELSHHLTPRMFANEIKKIDNPATVYAVQIKARFRDEVRRELEGLDLDRLAFPPVGIPFEV